MGLYQACRRAPKTMRKLLRSGAISGTGSETLVDTHFNPPYNPWDQRLCIAPGGDLFKALKDGGAQIVTGNIRTITEGGIELADGTTVSADVIVTATGLSISLLGKIALTVDGEPVNGADTVVFRGAMLSGVPNFAFCVGYINLSFTVRADMTARLVTRSSSVCPVTTAASSYPYTPGRTRTGCSSTCSRAACGVVPHSCRDQPTITRGPWRRTSFAIPGTPTAPISMTVWCGRSRGHIGMSCTAR